MSVLYFNNNFYPKVKSGRNFETEMHFSCEKGVAFQNENMFFASSLNEGGNIYSVSKEEVDPSMTLKEWVVKSFGDAEPEESQYEPGTCFKRIIRPLAAGGNLYRTVSQEKLTESFVSLRILLNKLEQLFDTVEPSELNFSVYGHKIREVLLLACMDVESSWSAVLKENEYQTPHTIWSTNDYVKLKYPMLLDTYWLTLQAYPNFPHLIPFRDWDVTNPTKSLWWYDAYNKTKHDREGSLKLATLGSAITAVGAAVIMFRAQFGSHFGITGNFDYKNAVVQSVFKIVTPDIKKYYKEFYISKVNSFDWNVINYKF